MITVMVSFRHPGDTAWGGRLVDQLRRVLVTDQLLIVDSATLEGPVPPAELGLVVIGPDWAGEGWSSRPGGRAIDDETDLLRAEVEAVLAGSERVVPVLVGGAELPTAHALPASLRPLADLAAVQLSDEHFREDVDQLSLTLLATSHAVRRREHVERETRRVRRGAAAGFVVLCLIGLFLPVISVAALVWALVSRRGLRARGGAGAVALANLGFGLALFSIGFNVFFTIDQFT